MTSYEHAMLGITETCTASMFAMVRWPTRLQSVALVTLFLVVIYLVGRGVS